MPKIKTNRTAYKKYRVSAGGKVKRAQANTSHNTSKKGAKRRRHLRQILVVDKTNVGAIRRMMPYLRKGN